MWSCLCLHLTDIPCHIADHFVPGIKVPGNDVNDCRSYNGAVCTRPGKGMDMLLLDRVPIQNCLWERDKDGRVFLIKEKTKNKLLKKVIGGLGRSQDFHIHLDDLGSAAWLETDGQRTILQIGAILKQAFAAKIEPAEPRLAQFFALLARDGFVRWRPEDPRPEGSEAPLSGEDV